MILEPQVQAHLDAMDVSAYHGADIDTRRKALRSEIDRTFTLFGLPGPPVEAVVDHAVPVREGSIVVRTYHPTRARLLPLHVLIHGGGWTTGSIDELVNDATARHRAVHADCIVALVEYRLAPEHPFPTAVYDVVDAVRWLRSHAGRLGADPTVTTLGGASAGGNLAAAAVIAADDLELCGLLLEVPALDLSPRSSSRPAATRGDHEDLFRTADAEYERVRLEYLADPARGASPLASPLLAPDLERFPETHILTAELDSLHEQGERFALRLGEAGVNVYVTSYEGALHGSPILTAAWPTARRWHDDTLAILRDLHRRAGAEAAS